MAAANGGQGFEVPELDIKFTKLFINGQFVDAASGKTFETRDPRTGEVIARIAEGDKADIDLAVKAARDAFDNGPWPRMPGCARARILHKFADLVDQHVEELAALDTVDAGKLFQMGKLVDIPGGANLLRYYAGAADKIHGETLKMARPLHGYTLKEPVGVVGHIVPWNYPTTMFFFKVSPALAAGCTMVGEICVAGTRIYVQEGIYDAFVNKSVELAKKSVVGDPFNPNVHQGPQVDKNQYEKVLKYIDVGKSEGATLLTGGKPCSDKGYYIEPAIFTDVKDDMSIAQEEIFGPVMALMKFKTMEEVIQKANSTRYGLAAGVVTKNIDTMNTVSRSVRSGVVWVNCYFAFDPDAPFGGCKMSGFGKDMGTDASTSTCTPRRWSLHSTTRPGCDLDGHPIETHGERFPSYI
ncbi:hypothetical protein ZWY2020_040806 [Hordeum vulgare]|nr:hypothetical protein ZWY2020_040806 [Hordeum vulgare]